MSAMSTAPPERVPSVRSGVVARIAQVGLIFLVLGAILFASAGTFAWPGAWAYLAISLVGVLVVGTTLLRARPEMIAERGRPKEVGRDKGVAALWALCQYVLVPLVAGLDVRFGWTGGLAVAWQVVGAVAVAVGFALFGWAMATNAFFSTAVRTQSDRGQTVCRTGPYRLVRHPGYLGADVMSVGGAVLLGSLWALVPALAAVVFMGVRTAHEDRMLQADLPGHREYAREVRYRIIPGVW